MAQADSGSGKADTGSRVGEALSVLQQEVLRGGIAALILFFGLNWFTGRVYPDMRADQQALMQQQAEAHERQLQLLIEQWERERQTMERALDYLEGHADSSQQSANPASLATERRMALVYRCPAPRRRMTDSMPVQTPTRARILRVVYGETRPREGT